MIVQVRLICAGLIFDELSTEKIKLSIMTKDAEYQAIKRLYAFKRRLGLCDLI